MNIQNDNSNHKDLPLLHAASINFVRHLLGLFPDQQDKIQSLIFEGYADGLLAWFRPSDCSFFDAATGFVSEKGMEDAVAQAWSESVCDALGDNLKTNQSFTVLFLPNR